MNYLKSFEMFESENFETLNEAAAAAVTPEAKELLTAEFKKLNPSQKAELKSELIELSAKLKLTPNEMKDTNKVMKALIDAGMVKESADYAGEELNEGLKSWWDKAKNNVYKWMTKIGVGGLVSGMATLVYGQTLMPNPDTLRHFETVTPNGWVIAGGAAMAISFLAVLAGLKGQGELGNVASAAAAAKR